MFRRCRTARREVLRLDVLMNRVLIVSVGKVRLVRSLFVLLGLIVLRCLFVVVRRPLMVTGSVMVMLPGL